MLILLSTSCGGVSQGLLDSVPASSPMVASIDVDAIFKQAGCRLDGDSVILTPELTKLFYDNRTATLPVPMRLFARLHGAVDMSRVVMFSVDKTGHDNLFVADITDPAEFEQRILTMAQPADGTEELTLYTVGDWSVAVADTRLWLGPVSSARLIEYITPLLTLKAGENVSRYVGISDFLGGPGALKLAVQPGVVSPLASNDQTSAWSCVTVKVENWVVGLDFRLMESDGKLVSLTSGMQELDTDFLRYVPQSYVFAAAAGFTSDFKWKELLGMVSLVIGPTNSSYMSFIAPVLSKVDGTVAFAAGPAAGAPAVANLGLDTWDLLMMVHMPQADVDNALSMLKSYSALGGLETETDDNVMVVTLPDGSKIYAGNVDGYLAVSNREFEADGTNSMTDVFLSKQAAMSLSVPAGSEIVKAFNLPCGFDLNMQMSDDDMHMRLSLNGSDRRVLQTVLELVAKKTK
ncbi:MAG: hypothetical protein K2M65_03680 [Muribaculaceae bacterium]|nr:hypothetical protein [Muribaculaceae bacterium]